MGHVKRLDSRVTVSALVCAFLLAHVSGCKPKPESSRPAGPHELIDAFDVRTNRVRRYVMGTLEHAWIQSNDVSNWTGVGVKLRLREGGAFIASHERADSNLVDFVASLKTGTVITLPEAYITFLAQSNRLTR